MKGIVFNLLEEVVRREYGVEAWEDLLEMSHVHGAYTSLGSYPDEELTELVLAAGSRYEMRADEVVRWFARESVRILLNKYPEFYAGHPDTRSFLLTLNDIIHPEVRKLYPGADAPDFEYDTTRPDVLLMAYRSRRKLCAFAEGLIQGSAAHYGERATIDQPLCANRGDERCVLRISLSKQEGGDGKRD